MTDHLIIDHGRPSISEAERAEAISDWLQAEQAIMWDRRGSGAQLRAHGVPLGELAQRLIDLALDVRFHERGVTGREVAVFLDGDGLYALLVAANSGTTTIPGDTMDALREAWQQWMERP